MLPRPSPWRAGAAIGWLAFRFGIAGIYFALLTIAFAEFARIGFDHLGWRRRLGRPLHAGRAAGGTCDWLDLRGGAADVLLCDRSRSRRWPSCSRPALRAAALGYFWLAIREDEEAAQRRRYRPSRYKIAAVVISAGMTALRRRVLRLLLQQPLPRAGLQHLAFDRDDPRAGHRRHRYAVRAGARRVPADRACRSPDAARCPTLGIDVPGVKQVLLRRLLWS